MRIVRCWIVAVATVAMAQDDASSLAWSSVGEAAGEAAPIGRRQPAALTWGDAGVVSISVVPQIYGLRGLRHGATGLILRGGSFGAGLSASTLDAGSSRRTWMRIAAGMQFAEGMAAGISFLGGRWSFPRYGPVYEGEVTAGAQFRTDRITTGFVVGVNVQQFRPASIEGGRIVVGSSIRLTDEITAVVEAVDAGSLDLRMGARAAIVEGLAVIVSWSDASGVAGAGLDARVSSWNALLGGRWHPVLGWTHGATVHYSWR